MKIGRIISLFIISISLSVGFSKAQELVWKANFHGFFDNREYFNDYTLPQTMFGARTEGQIGLKINDHQEILGGVSYLYEFGAKILDYPASPTLYFHYKQPMVNFYVGAFPRHNLVQLPELLASDTLEYYRPNIEGIYANFSKRWGSHNIWLDWTSRQTNTRDEMFALGATGTLKFGIFYYQHHFIMFHHAGAMIRDTVEIIRDNGGGSVNIGIDLSGKTIFDTLSFQSGYVMSYDQYRTDPFDVTIARGFRHELNIVYRRIGIRSILYHGDKQELILGDHFYRAKLYSRTDVYWQIFNKSNVQGRIEFGFHKTPEVLDLHQKLVVYVNLGNGLR